MRDAALKLQKWFMGPPETKEQVQRRQPSDSKAKAAEVAERSVAVNPPLGFELRVDLAHPYGRERGLAFETPECFGAGLCLSRGMFSGRFAIPLHDPDGQLVGYAGQSLDDADPKYLFPSSEKGFRKSHLLFTCTGWSKKGEPTNPSSSSRASSAS